MKNIIILLLCAILVDIKSGTKRGVVERSIFYYGKKYKIVPREFREEPSLITPSLIILEFEGKYFIRAIFYRYPSCAKIIATKIMSIELTEDILCRIMYRKEYLEFLLDLSILRNDRHIASQALKTSRPSFPPDLAEVMLSYIYDDTIKTQLQQTKAMREIYNFLSKPVRDFAAEYKRHNEFDQSIIISEDSAIMNQKMMEIQYSNELRDDIIKLLKMIYGFVYRDTLSLDTINHNASLSCTYLAICKTLKLCAFVTRCIRKDHIFSNNDSGLGEKFYLTKYGSIEIRDPSKSFLRDLRDQIWLLELVMISALSAMIMNWINIKFFLYD